MSPCPRVPARKSCCLWQNFAVSPCPHVLDEKKWSPFFLSLCPPVPMSSLQKSKNFEYSKNLVTFCKVKGLCPLRSEYLSYILSVQVKVFCPLVPNSLRSKRKKMSWHFFGLVAVIHFPKIWGFTVSKLSEVAKVTQPDFPASELPIWGNVSLPPSQKNANTLRG